MQRFWKTSPPPSPLEPPSWDAIIDRTTGLAAADSGELLFGHQITPLNSLFLSYLAMLNSGEISPGLLLQAYPNIGWN